MGEVAMKISKYISSLKFIDIMFFCTLMLLIILIVILINLLKSDKYMLVKKEKNEEKSDMNIKEDIKENIKADLKEEIKEELKEELSPSDKVIEEKIEKAKDEEPLDLVALTKEINEKPTINIDLTSYEAEQEEKAIISYDELVKSRSNYSINYEDEDLTDGILVKKVDLEHLTTELSEDAEESNDVKANIAISYDHEEAFLQALKQLQEMLNS